MSKGATKSKENYGISRIDDDSQRKHGWRVSLRRHGRMHIRNFPDRKYGGKRKARQEAKQFRDDILAKYPPITRKEVCNRRRSNNNSGITGVCSYSKSYELRDGTIRENWYWEANWPNQDGKPVSESFSVKKYGEEMARYMAIRAREKGLAAVEGYFWASERGAPRDHPEYSRDATIGTPDRHVA
jgi:hypothetical protein